MFTGKRPLSTNDDNVQETPALSPNKFACIPHNTPEESPRFSIPEGPPKSLTSKKQFQNFSNVDFHNQLLQALLNKFPDKIVSKEKDHSNWIKIPNSPPRLILTPTSQSPVGNNTTLSIENVENYNLLCITRSIADLEMTRTGSCSDQMSTMATCASDRSIMGSLSDIEKSFFDEDSTRLVHSSSLDNLEYRRRAKSFDVFIGSEDYKWCKRASSLDDLQKASNYIEFEILF